MLTWMSVLLWFICMVFIYNALFWRCDDLPATITHVPVAAVLVLNTPDEGRLTPETCRVTLQK